VTIVTQTLIFASLSLPSCQWRNDHPATGSWAGGNSFLSGSLLPFLLGFFSFHFATLDD
jgi:hypothetical protein